jgi:hypothetical protein
VVQNFLSPYILEHFNTTSLTSQIKLTKLLAKSLLLGHNKLLKLQILSVLPSFISAFQSLSMTVSFHSLYHDMINSSAGFSAIVYMIDIVTSQGT